MARSTGTPAAAPDELAQVLAAWSKALQDLGSDLYERAFRNRGMAALSLVQFRYFDLIAREPGVTPGQLARALGVARPTVANTLAGLRRKGLIRSSVSETDARVQNLYLTDAAREIVDYRQSMYWRMAAGLREVLTPGDCTSLLGILKKSLGPLVELVGTRKEGP